MVILKIEQTTSTGLETMGVPRLQTLVPQQITLMEPEEVSHLRKEFNFWKVHRIMNTSLKETPSIHDSMNRPKIDLLLILISKI